MADSSRLFRVVRMGGQLIALSLSAWLGGWIAFCLAWAVIFPPFRFEHVGGSMFGSLCPYGVCLAALYFPALVALRTRLNGIRPLWAFPLVAVPLGIIPVTVLIFFLGGNFHSFFSAETALLYIGLTVTGSILGFGFPFIYEDPD